MKVTKKQLRDGIVLLSALFLATVMTVMSAVSTKADTVWATSTRCALANANTVTFNATYSALPASDDGLFYLFQLMPYEYGVTATAPCLGTTPIGPNPSFSFGLYDAAGTSRICRKFVLAVKCGGAFTLVSNCQYIVNPEVAATHTRAPQNVGFVEPYNKMVLYRIGETNVGAILIDNYSTAVIVNKVTPSLISPYARIRDSHPVSSKFYYMFNAATADGCNTLQNTMSAFAMNTHVDEFIIGNEVNSRLWNYTASMDWGSYIREYAQAFRVAYNSIKSVNANAKVYISLDQMWNMDKLSDYSFIDGADFTLLFNQIIAAEGNIDWGMALHPYPYPMTYAKFWDPSGLRNGAYFQSLVAQGKVVTFQNLPVVTSFMQTPGLLSPNGQVRSIILPEIGITSAQGVETQAAGIMACYQAARNNPFIKRIYFHRMNEGGATNFGTSGLSEAVYQAIEKGQPGEYNAWALNYIGITDWRQVVMY